MTHKDLLEKELSNLYALTKQVNHYLDGSLIEFLEPAHKDVVENYLALNCELEEQMAQVLQEQGINPGNTTDSIVQEITENLKQTAADDIEDEVKSSGYRLSLNRLLCYELANLENLIALVDNTDVKEGLNSYRDQVSSLKNSLL